MQILIYNRPKINNPPIIDIPIVEKIESIDPIIDNTLVSDSNNEIIHEPEIIPEPTLPVIEPIQENKIAINNELELYGESILHHINDTFQMRLQGSIPVDDIKTMLNNSDQRYSYRLKGNVGNSYIEISNDTETIRIPRDSNRFINTRL